VKNKNVAYCFPNHLVDYIEEISLDYENIVSKSDIDIFKKNATKYDEVYINELMGKCVNWAMKKDWDDIYHQRLRRDEIKVLERVKYRLNKIA
jgi:hypothetical protein